MTRPGVDMGLLQAVLADRSQRCDACGKKFGAKTPCLLPLFESGYGVRKSASNTIVVCTAAAQVLSELRLSDVLRTLAGRLGAFECPRRRSVKAAGKSSAKAKAERARSSAVLPGASTKAADKLRPEAAWPFTSASVQPANTNTRRNLRTPLGGADSDEAESSSSAAEGFSVQRLEIALSAGRLTALQIRLVLDRAKSLGLDQKLITALECEYKRQISDVGKCYVIDEEGVVSTIKLEKSRHESNVSLAEGITYTRP